MQRPIPNDKDKRHYENDDHQPFKKWGRHAPATNLEAAYATLDQYSTVDAFLAAVDATSSLTQFHNSHGLSQPQLVIYIKKRFFPQMESHSRHDNSLLKLLKRLRNQGEDSPLAPQITNSEDLDNYMDLNFGKNWKKELGNETTKQVLKAAIKKSNGIKDLADKLNMGFYECIKLIETQLGSTYYRIKMENLSHNEIDSLFKSSTNKISLHGAFHESFAIPYPDLVVYLNKRFGPNWADFISRSAPAELPVATSAVDGHYSALDLTPKLYSTQMSAVLLFTPTKSCEDEKLDLAFSDAERNDPVFSEIISEIEQGAALPKPS